MEEKAFKYLEIVAQLLPIPIYWLDKNNLMLGVNNLFRRSVGIPYNFDPVGKTASDVYPKDMAEKISQHNQKVIASGEVLYQEEAIADITTGEIKYFNAFKAPFSNSRHC